MSLGIEEITGKGRMGKPEREKEISESPCENHSEFLVQKVSVMLEQGTGLKMCDLVLLGDTEPVCFPPVLLFPALTFVLSIQRVCSKDTAVSCFVYRAQRCGVQVLGFPGCW